MRNFYRLAYAVSLLACFCFTSGFAASPVWKVESDTTLLYLGGTIHVLRDQDYPLPPAFLKAFNHAAILVFETDIDELKTAEFSHKLVQKMRLPKGQRLSQLLSADVYTLLQNYCRENGVNLGQLDGFSPSFVVLSLVSLEFAKLGFSATGVDEFLFRKARNNADQNKQNIFLETVDEQLDFISAMGQGNEDEFVRQSLNDFKVINHQFGQMVKAWRTGDLDQLDNLLIKDSLQKFPKMYQQLIVARNQNWLPDIIRLIKTRETEFVLVGTAHLIGKDGLLSQLEQQGFRVSQMQ